MATVLKNVLTFAGVLPGATSAGQAPNLLIEDVVQTPSLLICDSPQFRVTYFGGLVTVTNLGGALTSCNVLCEYWHSVSRAFKTGVPATFYAANATIGSSFSDQGYFGDGSDGDVVAVGLTTLARDMYYDNFDTGIGGNNIDCAGFRMFVRDTLTIRAGSIVGRLGNAGTIGLIGGAGTAGAALAAASLGDSAAGGAGGATSPGVAGNATAESWGGDAGVGGASSGQAGGALALAVNPIATTSQPRHLPGAITMLNYATLGAITDIRGGAGGGGGGATGANGGGGGGGGGGVVMIAARNIVVEAGGVISVEGGAGGDGYPTGDAGGGGGGGGGAVSLVYAALNNLGTIVATGGAGGAAGNGVSFAGAAGTAGTVFLLPVR